MVLASAFWEMAFYGSSRIACGENSDCGAAWGQVAAGRPKAARALPPSRGSGLSRSAVTRLGSLEPPRRPRPAPPPANPEKAPAGLLSMMATDRFDRLYREKLAYIIAVLNHNARIGNCNALLDWHCALGVN